MQRFLQKILPYISIPIFVIGTNLTVDPFGYFIELEEPAELLNNGKLLGNFTGYDERLLVELLLEKKAGEHFDVIVLGSSRSLQINSAIFENRTLLNLSVSQARIQDLVAIWNLLIKGNITFEEIILNVDPELIFGKPDGRWNSYNEDYRLGLVNLDLDVNTLTDDGKTSSKIEILLSPNVFRSSLKKLIQDKGFEKFAILSDTLGYTGAIKFPDGSLLYPKGKRDNGDQENVSRFLSSKHHVFGSEDVIGLRAIILKKLVNAIKTKAKLTLFMAPYSSRLFSADSDYKLSVEKTRKYIEENFEDIRRIGSFNLTGEYRNPKDFYDLNHPKREIVEEILSDY